MTLKTVGSRALAAALAICSFGSGWSLPAPAATSGNDRPFRLGYLPLNTSLNRDKPLAMIDGGGFTVNSGVLIGAFDDTWIGGMSMVTRKVQWWLDGKVSMTAPPGSFGSSVVLGFRDGRVLKADALSGEVQWTANLDSFTERQFLLSGTVLYVMTAAQVLYALDFQTGKTLWLFDGGFPEGLAVRAGARPLIHDGKVICGLTSGELIAVSADTGKLVWRYNPAYNDQRFHDVTGEMIVRNNRLIISRYDGFVAAIDLGTSVRSVVWQDMLPSVTTSTFRGGRFYLGALNGEVHAIDPDAGGRKIWRVDTGASVVSITAGETTLLIAGQDGRVTAVDAATGAIQWHDQLGGSLASMPVLFEDAVMFTTGLKSLYAYRLK